MKQHASQLNLVLLALVLSATACKKDPVENPNPPQQQLPNPLPTHALVRQQKWSENDHQSFSYNAKGQVTQLRMQWQYVEGDPSKIRTVVYDFQYDAQDRPVQLSYTGGFTTQYVYHGNLIHKTRELLPGGDLAKEVTYIYANNRIVQETWRVTSIPGEPDDVYKHVFGYDARGNLNKVEIYEQTGPDAFKLLETTEFSDFDDAINPLGWLTRYPFLPQLRLQFNNPRKEVRKPAEGPAVTTVYSYSYNAQGLPVHKQSLPSTGGVFGFDYYY